MKNLLRLLYAVFVTISVSAITASSAKASSPAPSLDTVGDLRKACLILKKVEVGTPLNTKEAFDFGNCHGYLLRDVQLRNTLCTFNRISIDLQGDSNLSETLKGWTRKITYPNVKKHEQVIYSFLNWADANPHLWESTLEIDVHPKLFTEFPCEYD